MGELGPPTGRGPPAAGEGVGLRGEVLVLTVVRGTYWLGRQERAPPRGFSRTDSWIWEEGWEMGGCPVNWLWLRPLVCTLRQALLLSGSQSPHP